MNQCFKSLLLMVTALAVSVSVRANNQLTIYDDGDENSNLSPINMVYLDEVGTRCQVIFPADALAEMNEEPINSITFYIAGSGITINGGLVRVSVGETSQASFFSDYITDGLVQVATISMVEGVKELLITFDAPFLYHGGNLVIDTYVEQETDYSYDLFEGYRPDYYSTITRGEVSKFLPKTTFDYGTDDQYAAKVLPTEVTFNTIRAEREDEQTVVLKNIGIGAFTPSFIVDAPFIVDFEAENPEEEFVIGELAADESLEVPVKFAPMTPGAYDGILTIDCGPAGILQVALHGTAIEPAIDLTVADETDYASFVPIYGADIDIVGTQSQVIYPETMLTDMVGRDILALRFHTYKEVQMNGGVIQLSLKPVDKNEFTTETLETGTTVVATVVPVYKSYDLEFVFDQPYRYEGGNLLVDCLVTEPGITNYRQTFFYGTPTEDVYVGLAKTLYYGSTFEYNLVPFLPEATFSYSKASSLRGDVNKDGKVNISDVTTLINYLLSSGEKPAEADTNLDQNVNITDVTALINYLLSGNW